MTVKIYYLRSTPRSTPDFCYSNKKVILLHVILFRIIFVVSGKILSELRILSKLFLFLITTLCSKLFALKIKIKIKTTLYEPFMCYSYLRVIHKITFKIQDQDSLKSKLAPSFWIHYSHKKSKIPFHLVHQVHRKLTASAKIAQVQYYKLNSILQIER